MVTCIYTNSVSWVVWNMEKIYSSSHIVRKIFCITVFLSTLSFFYMFILSSWINDLHTVGYNEVKLRNGIGTGEGEKQRTKEAGC